MWQSLPKPCDERSAGGAACRPQGVAFAVDAVALVILFFDPAGNFLERNGGALASGETAVASCGADGRAWAGQVYLFIQPWRATYHSG